MPPTTRRLDRRRSREPERLEPLVLRAVGEAHREQPERTRPTHRERARPCGPERAHPDASNEHHHRQAIPPMHRGGEHGRAGQRSEAWPSRAPRQQSAPGIPPTQRRYRAPEATPEAAWPASSCQRPAAPPSAGDAHQRPRWPGPACRSVARGCLEDRALPQTGHAA